MMACTKKRARVTVGSSVPMRGSVALSPRYSAPMRYPREWIVFVSKTTDCRKLGLTLRPFGDVFIVQAVKSDGLIAIHNKVDEGHAIFMDDEIVSINDVRLTLNEMLATIKNEECFFFWVRRQAPPIEV